jgi:hypothetical protein
LLPKWGTVVEGSNSLKQAAALDFALSARVRRVIASRKRDLVK